MLYSKTLLFIHNYFQKPSFFVAWVSVYILRYYDLDRNSNSRKIFLLFFLVFVKGLSLVRGEILLLLSIRFSSFLWGAVCLLLNIMSVYFNHIGSWYHSLFPAHQWIQFIQTFPWQLSCDVISWFLLQCFLYLCLHKFTLVPEYMGFPGGSVLKNLPKEPTCPYRRCGFTPWVGKIPWRRKWQPIPVFLPGKSHGWRSHVAMAGYSPWGHKRVRHDSVTKQQQPEYIQAFWAQTYSLFFIHIPLFRFRNYIHCFHVGLPQLIMFLSVTLLK